MDSRDPVVVFFEKSVIQSITLLRKRDLQQGKQKPHKIPQVPYAAAMLQHSRLLRLSYLYSSVERPRNSSLVRYRKETACHALNHQLTTIFESKNRNGRAGSYVLVNLLSNQFYSKLNIGDEETHESNEVAKKIFSKVLQRTVLTLR